MALSWCGSSWFPVPVTLGNFIVPLMIGARDLAFPKINLMSWYLFVPAALTLCAMFCGGIEPAGLSTRRSPPLRAKAMSPAAVGVFIAGFSSIATGLNFIVTTHRLRAPGLTWYRLPIFIWSLYSTSVIMVLATPVLAITLLLLVSSASSMSAYSIPPRRRSAAVPAHVLVLLASRPFTS